METLETSETSETIETQSTLPPYHYTSLSDPSRNIRVINLQPGEFGVPIVFEIVEIELAEGTGQPNAPRYSSSYMQEIQKTLPINWLVMETVDRRLLYRTLKKDDGDYYPVTSWDHPSRPDLYPNDSGSNNDSSSGYEALSYAWGDGLEREIAMVQPDPPTGGVMSGFQISTTLAEALGHLRRRESARLLWVDAICINQKDDSEKNQQVRRMGKIFSQAQRVVAWLGPESPSSRQALEVVQYIGSQIELGGTMGLNPSPGCAHPTWFMPHIHISYGLDIWKSISELLRASWFSRLWILQEIILASPHSVLKCGHDEIGWTVFRRAMLCLFMKDDAPIDRIWHVSVLCEYYRPYRFDQLVYDNMVRHCKDPRDKIYALLHLSPPRIRREIPVAYSLPAFDVYKHTTLSYMKITKSLELLRQAGPPNPFRSRGVRFDSPPRPTWVPDWSGSILMIQGADHGFSAAAFSSSEARYCAPDQLEIMGVLVGAVTSAQEIQANKFDDIVDLLHKDLGGVEALLDSQYFTGETQLRARLLTLVEDSMVGGTSLDKSPISYQQLEREIVEDSWTMRVLCSLSDGRRVRTQILRSCSESYLFSLDSDQKHFGKSPIEVLPGDVVFVALGCSTPLILRPTAKEQRYEVVGDCYVHGIMYGEALLGPIDPAYKPIKRLGKMGRFKTYFKDPLLGEYCYSDKDPRLANAPLLDEWEMIRSPDEETLDDPRNFVGEFKNKITGEITNGDPRLLPEALTARGLCLTTVTLV